MKVDKRTFCLEEKIDLGLQNHTDGDSSHGIKRYLLYGGKAITHLDSISKSRDVTLPTKVHLVKGMCLFCFVLFCFVFQ